MSSSFALIAYLVLLLYSKISLLYINYFSKKRQKLQELNCRLLVSKSSPVASPLVLRLGRWEHGPFKKYSDTSSSLVFFFRIFCAKVFIVEIVLFTPYGCLAGLHAP